MITTYEDALKAIESAADDAAFLALKGELTSFFKSRIERKAKKTETDPASAYKRAMSDSMPKRPWMVTAESKPAQLPIEATSPGSK